MQTVKGTPVRTGDGVLADATLAEVIAWEVGCSKKYIQVDGCEETGMLFVVGPQRGYKQLLCFTDKGFGINVEHVIQKCRSSFDDSTW